MRDARAELLAVEHRCDELRAELRDLEHHAEELRALAGEHTNPAPGYRATHWGHGGTTPIIRGCKFADPRGRLELMGEVVRIAYRTTKTGWPANSVFTHPFDASPLLAYSPEGLLAIGSPPDRPQYRITMRGIEG